MAHFGESFGGLSQFGGGDSLTETYYRTMRSLMLPGFWPSDDSASPNVLLKADALALSAAQAIVDSLLREAFPHQAALTMDAWSSLLGVVHAPSATLQQRRDAILSVWRGAQPSTRAGLRSMLVDLLRPEHLWRDGFDDSALSWRYDADIGGGSLTEVAGQLTIDTGFVDCSWGNHPRLMFPLTSRDDAVIVEAHLAAVDTYTAANHAICRVALGVHDDDDSGIHLGIYYSALGWRVLLERWTDGVRESLTDPVQVLVGSGSPSPALAAKLVVQANGDVYGYIDEAPTVRGKVGDAVAPVVSYVGGEVSLVRRKAGLLAWNAGATYDAAADVETLWVAHGSQVNNVDVAEFLTSEVNDASDIFFGFVKRSSFDLESYDLANAQRVADRAKQAHTLLLVGESNEFAVDDLMSLVDRDTLGA